MSRCFNVRFELALTGRFLLWRRGFVSLRVPGDRTDRRSRALLQVERQGKKGEARVHELVEIREAFGVYDPVLLADHVTRKLNVERVVDPRAVGADVHDTLACKVFRAAPVDTRKLVHEFLAREVLIAIVEPQENDVTAADRLALLGEPSFGATDHRLVRIAVAFRVGSLRLDLGNVEDDRFSPVALERR